MLPQDWEGDDPVEARIYLQELRDWKDTRDRLIHAQTQARAALDAAEARRGLIDGWATQVRQMVTPLEPRRTAYDRCVADISATTADIAHDDGLINDWEQSVAVATSRLLGSVPLHDPLVLLPLRLEARWTADELLVRIFPDNIGIDTHDKRLTPAEEAAGERYWDSVGDEAATLNAWDQLVRVTGAPRAAYVARACDPDGPTRPVARASGWDTAMAARTLPERFAVMAIGDGMLRDLGGGRHVIWGQPVPAALEYPLLDPPDSATWLNDFASAESVGMAVRIPLQSGAAPIETLLVLGIRAGDDPNLAGLLEAHSYTGGLEILPDATTTNNSAELRSALDRARQSAAAREQITPGAVPPLGSSGEQVATLLGIDPSMLAGVRGATIQRAFPVDAMKLLIGTAVLGALQGALGDGGAGWPVVEPIGPAPNLRIGRQPYGILPTTAPGRWGPGRQQETGAALQAALREWSRLHGSQSLVDPADPPHPPSGGTQRSANSDGDDGFDALLLELPQSMSWTSPSASYRTPDELVGPSDGSTSPAQYLEQVAAADLGDLAALRTALPPLLAQVAIAAKENAIGSDERSQVEGALRNLASTLTAGADDDGRIGLSRLVCSVLDTASHRFDAWVTGAAAERLRVLRGTAGNRSVVGAYGWLIDLAPAKGRRSEGHVLAPSLAHAATAGVLRSGYLAGAGSGEQDGSQQPLAVDLSSASVRGALRTLDAVRAGQPLAAVLGRAFEDDLVAFHLQRYLASFRKLTRFRTGGALDHLEDARAGATTALTAARAELARLEELASVAAEKAAVANAGLSAAKARQDLAETAAGPYAAKRDRADQLSSAIIPQLVANLAAIDAQRPQPATRHHTITVPDP